MLRKFGQSMTGFLQRWMPEPFVFALLLTLLVTVLALVYTDAGIGRTVDGWYKGFWLLLEFGMQIVLILSIAYAVALSPVFARLIDWLAQRVHSPSAVYLLVIVVGALFSLINFGLIVVGAILAREMAKRVDGLDYPFLVACVYLASQPWVGGLSSAVPLFLGTENNFLIQSGALGGTISASQTLGSTLNLLYLLSFFIGMPLIMWWMKPKTSDSKSIFDLTETNHKEQLTVQEEAEKLRDAGSLSVSDRLNNSTLLHWAITALALLAIARYFFIKNQGLDLNIMIFIFLALGLILHQTPMRFIIAMKRACANMSGIIYQYPFYAGIMGIMMFTGLGNVVSDALASYATVQTIPVIAQMAAAIINFAIPSAGGEWAVVGPAFMDATQTVAASLPADKAQALIARVAMSIAYGEASSNLLQPFFILVILPVMGAGVRVRARDVMGYLVIPFIYMSLAIGLLVSYLPL